MSKYRIEIILILVVLAVYLPIFGYIRQVAESGEVGSPAADLPIYGSDSEGFVSLANNLLHNGNFGHHPGEVETFRTPGYPLMLAGWEGIFGSLDFFPLVQIFLVIIASLLLYRLGTSLFSRGIGFVSALLFALDPNVIFHTQVILSEIPFVMLLLLVTYLLFAARRGFLLTREAWAGIVLAVATLIKPVSMYLPIVFVAAIILACWASRREFVKQILVPSLAFLLTFTAVLLPWICRNVTKTGSFGVASVAALNFFSYYVPEFLSARDGISPDEARIKLQRTLPDVPASEYDNLRHSSTLMKESFRYILSDPFRYASFHAVKTLPLFLSSGVENVFATANDVAGTQVFLVNPVNMTNLLLKRDFGAFAKALASAPLIALEQFFWCFVLFFVIIALFVKKHRRTSIVTLFLIVIYFAAVSGPASYARFRLPITPYLFVLACVGFTGCLVCLSRRLKERTAKLPAKTLFKT